MDHAVVDSEDLNMTRVHLIWLMLAGLSAVLALLVVSLRAMRLQERVTLRIEGVRRNAGEPVEPSDAKYSLVVRGVSALGAVVARSGLLSARTLSEFEHTLSVSGFRGRSGLGIFIGSKVLLLVVLPVIAWGLLDQTGLAPMLRNLLTLAAAAIGLLGPDFAVRRLRRQYLRGVERGLPDALDLLIICTEAGLSLGPAIARVATEIRIAHLAVADELAQTANELRVTTDSRAALYNAANRTGLDSMKRVALTLAQSIQFGTPLAQALRTLSAEMRQEILTRFEAQAARLPVLLTVPMIVFILPCVFLIVGGPAILQLLAVLKG
jgi:tight adherence protein C